MIYYCMSDIHGCISAFEKALELVLPQLDDKNTRLILLGDYIHEGEDSYAVLDRIMGLQKQYGSEIVIALMGNHEEMACDNMWYINDRYPDDTKDKPYIEWMKKLPLFYNDGKTIFVHAGIDEDAQDLWKVGTQDFIFTEKYPAQTGHFYEDYIIVAGHVHTSEIAGSKRFHGIYFDGKSHYYIDADTLKSKKVNVLKVDTSKQKYYIVTPKGERTVKLYDRGTEK